MPRCSKRKHDAVSCAHDRVCNGRQECVLEKRANHGQASNRGPIGLPTPLEEIEGFRKKPFIQKQFKQYCLLNAFNNMYGRVVITADAFHAFREHQDNVCYKPWRDKAVSFFKDENIGVKEKEIKDYEKSLMNGDKQGNWNISVLSDYLTGRTDVRIVKLTKHIPANQSIPIATVQNIMQEKKCLLFHCVWYQHKINQSHFVAYNNGYVIDGLKGTKVLFEDFPLKSFIVKIYCVEINPNV